MGSWTTLALALLTSQPTPGSDPVDAAKLVGVWNNQGIYTRLHNDHTLTIGFDPTGVRRDFVGTYRVTGRTLTLRVDVGFQFRERVLTIQKLTDEELVCTEGGKPVTMKRHQVTGGPKAAQALLVPGTFDPAKLVGRWKQGLQVYEFTSGGGFAVMLAGLPDSKDRGNYQVEGRVVSVDYVAGFQRRTRVWRVTKLTDTELVVLEGDETFTFERAK